MSIVSTLSYFRDLIRYRPEMAHLYFRNRWRQAMLPLDYRRTDGVSRWPRNVTLKLTLACNLRCKMCAFHESGLVASKLSESMPLDQWKAVVDDVAPFRPYISLTGGEPLLHPHVTDILAYIRGRGLSCTLTTNATLLTRRADKLMEAPPDMLAVSIDGPAGVHDEIRGAAGTFERATEGVRAVQEIKRRTGNHRPWIILTCAVTTHNYGTIDRMPEIALDLGAQVMNFQYQWVLTQKMANAQNHRYGKIHPISYEEMGGMEMPEVDADEVMKAVGRIDRLRGAGRVWRGIYVGLHPTPKPDEVRRWYRDPHDWIRRRTPACAWTGVNILPNGDVEACPGMIPGNVADEPLTEIWNNEAYREHRLRLIESRGLPICPRCCRYLRVD